MMLFEDPVMDQEEELRRAREMISRLDPGSLDAFNRRQAASQVRPNLGGPADVIPIVPGVPTTPAPSLFNDVDINAALKTTRSDREIAADMIRNSVGGGEAMADRFLNQNMNAARDIISRHPVPGQVEQFNEYYGGAVPDIGARLPIQENTGLFNNSMPAGLINDTVLPAPIPGPSGPRIDTGFDAMGNLMPGVRPELNTMMTRQMERNLAMPVIDSFMSPDPVQVLGYTGQGNRSLPTTDYSGPMARSQAARQQLALMDLFSREDEGAANRDVRSLFAQGPAIKAGQMRDMARNKALMLISNAKVPNEVAKAEIEAMAKSGEIDQKEANSMLLERQLSKPDAQGMLRPVGADAKTGSLHDMLSRVPANADTAEVKKYLMENRGITRDQVVARYQQLLEQGMPFLDPTKSLGGIFAGPNRNPDTFNKNNLSADERAEFDAITRIFGAK